MNIAVIDGDKLFLSNLEKLLRNFHHTFNLFNSSKDFGHANLKDFDFIIIGNSLPDFKNKSLFNSILSKTKVDMAFLDSNLLNYDQDVENERVVGIIKKDDINSLIDLLKYVEIKNRVQKKVIETKEKLSNLKLNFI